MTSPWEKIEQILETTGSVIEIVIEIIQLIFVFCVILAGAIITLKIISMSLS